MFKQTIGAWEDANSSGNQRAIDDAETRRVASWNEMLRATMVGDERLALDAISSLLDLDSEIRKLEDELKANPQVGLFLIILI